MPYHVIRKLIVALTLILMPLAAQAQSGNMTYGGAATPGHVPRCQNSGCTVLVDGGGAAGSTTPGVGYLTELGITATGTPLCINDALTNASGGYHQLCFGANALGGGLLSYQAENGASNLPFEFIINGSVYPFPGPGSGDVLGPSTSTVGDLAVWNNTSGTLLKDVPVGPEFTSTGGSGHQFDLLLPKIDVCTIANVKCDGTTDDSAAINAKMAATVGWRFYVPPLTTVAVGTTGIIVPANTSFSGAGRVTSVVKMTANSGSPVVTLNGNYSSVSDISLNGNSSFAGPRYSDGILIGAISNAKVTNVEVYGAGDNGIEDTGVNSTIFSNYVHNNNTNGIYVDGTTSNYASGGEIASNIVNNNSIGSFVNNSGNTIASGGTGYGNSLTFNLTVTSVTCTVQPVLSVSSNGSGVVTRINSVVTPGVCPSSLNTLASNASTSGGTGSGATLDLSVTSWDGIDLDPCHYKYRVHDNQVNNNDIITVGAYASGSSACGAAYGDIIAHNTVYSSDENGLSLLGQLNDELISSNIVLAPIGYCLQDNTNGYAQSRIHIGGNICHAPTLGGDTIYNGLSNSSGGPSSVDFIGERIDSVGSGYSGIIVTSGTTNVTLEGNIVTPGAGSAYAVDTSGAAANSSVIIDQSNVLAAGGSGTVNIASGQLNLAGILDGSGAPNFGSVLIYKASGDAGILNVQGGSTSNVYGTISNTSGGVRLVQLNGSAELITTTAENLALGYNGSVSTGITIISGGSYLNGTVNMPSIANTAGNEILCYATSTGAVTYESAVSGCVPSDPKLKNHIAYVNPFVAMFRVAWYLAPAIYTFKDVERFGANPEVGFYATDVCAMDMMLCRWDSEGTLNYDKIGLSAYLAAALKGAIYSVLILFGLFATDAYRRQCKLHHRLFALEHPIET